MFTLNAILQAKQVVDTADALGAKLPPAVLTAFERATRVSSATKNLSPGEGALAGAVAAALDEGRDPAADPEVTRVLVAGLIANRGIDQGVEAIVAEEMAAVFAQHADAIVRALARPFDRAAAVVAAAHERIGDHPLDDTAAILKKGGDVGEVWGRAKDAVAVIARIDADWLALADVTRFAPVDRRYAALRIADASSPEVWAAAGLEGRKGADAWSAVLAGLTLGLADSTEYARRVAAVQPVEAPPKARAA